MLIRSDRTTLATMAAETPAAFVPRSWIALLGIVLSMGGCSMPHDVADQSALLASSGFVERPADTQQRQAMLARLPQYTLVRRHWNGEALYVYAGNPACNCAYLGNEAAFARYRQNVQRAAQAGTAETFWEAQRGSDQQQSFAVAEDPGFDPGLWGMSPSRN